MERSLWVQEGAVEAVKYALCSQEGSDFRSGKEAQQHIFGKLQMDTLSKAHMKVGRREAVGQEGSFTLSGNGS